jgi:hypothetical protein
MILEPLLILSINSSSIIRTNVDTPSRKLHTRVLVAVFTLGPLPILHPKIRLSYFYSKSFMHLYIYPYLDIHTSIYTTIYKHKHIYTPKVIIHQVLMHIIYSIQ